MKSLLAIATLLISLSSFSACNPEAQFVGSVTKVKYFPATESSEEFFTFQLKLGHWFQPNIMCPLFEEELETAIIELPGVPTLSAGDKISGVLVFDINTEKYRIE